MHGPAGFGGPFFGPGRRAGRGDIRAAILALLAEEPMHGYQIIQVISERSGGNWTPSPGSVYPTLQQLEDEGLIEPAASESGRRVFALTDAGSRREQARAAAARRRPGRRRPARPTPTSSSSATSSTRCWPQHAGRPGGHRSTDQGRAGRPPHRPQEHLPPARRGRREA